MDGWMDGRMQFRMRCNGFSLHSVLEHMVGLCGIQNAKHIVLIQTWPTIFFSSFHTRLPYLGNIDCHSYRY